MVFLQMQVSLGKDITYSKLDIMSDFSDRCSCFVNGVNINIADKKEPATV